MLRKLGFGWRLFWIVRKTGKLAKKAEYEPKKFDLQYRTDYLVRKIKRTLKTFKINLSVSGYDNLGNGPAVLVGNHQDNVDPILVIYALKKQTEERDAEHKVPTFLAKHTLQYNKTSRNILTSINTFFLDRNDPRASLQTYQDFGKFIKENKTFGVIFAEGTRNKEGDVGVFKPGAFKVAKKELLPIVPFTINNSVQGSSIKRNQTLNIEVIFHKRIPALSLTTQNTVAIAERVHKIVKGAFKPPELPFISRAEEDEAQIEQSKGALKWKKKVARKEQKVVKKEQKERKQEQRLLEAQEREDAKYEKYQAKKQSKTNAEIKDETDDK